MFSSFAALHKSAFLISFLLFFSLCFLLLPLIYLGLPVGHDPGFYFVSYNGFKSSLGDGYLYPRWLNNVNNGFGGANFYFYPPLLFFSIFFLDAVTFFTLKPDVLFMITAFLLFFFSGISFYVFAKQRASNLIAFAGSLIYMSLPYHYGIELFDRFALAEFASYIFIPLIFYGLCLPVIQKAQFLIVYVLSYCGLILCHLPTALLVSVFIGLYSMMRLRSFDHKKECFVFFGTVGGASILSLLICAFYLIPALGLQHISDTEYLWQGFYSYEHWFLTYSPAMTVPNRGYVIRTFIIMMMNVTLVFFSYLYMAKDQDREREGQLKQFFVLLIISLFLMLPVSSFIWEHLSLLQKVQFPWRVMVLCDFFTAVCFFLILARAQTSKYSRLQFFSVVLIYLVSMNLFIAFRGNSLEAENKSTEARIIFSQESTREHVPLSPVRTKSFDDIMDNPPPSFISYDEENLEVTVKQRKAQQIEFHIEAQRPSTIYVRQFYSPLWAISVGEKDLVSVEYEAAPIALSLRPAEPYGHIAFDVPAGRHHVFLQIRPTKHEIYGWMISAFTFLVFLGLCCGAAGVSRKKGA